MRLSSFLPFLPLLVAAQVFIPDGALEGLAVHLEDESGNITYVHQSEFENYGLSLAIDDTSPNSTNITSLMSRSLPPGDSITCDDPRTFQIVDLHSNMIQLADYLACGYTIITNPSSNYKYVAMSNYKGSSVIYICNYSGSYRTMKGPQLFDFLEQVFNYCGQKSSAGWYHESFYNMAWGYTRNNYGFCGPAQ